jgi:hypothetical protein
MKARALVLLAAGALDAVTGALLVASPARVLSAMGATEILAEPAWMRFIGAFVLGVGAASLAGLARRDDPARLAQVLESTAVVRVAIALFTGGCLIAGALSPAWLAVCLSDASVAALQLALAREPRP